MIIDGIGVVVENGQLSPEEVQFYINKIEKNSQKKLQKITFSLGVNCKCKLNTNLIKKHYQ